MVVDDTTMARKCHPAELGRVQIKYKRQSKEWGQTNKVCNSVKESSFASTSTTTTLVVQDQEDLLFFVPFLQFDFSPDVPWTTRALVTSLLFIGNDIRKIATTFVQKCALALLSKGTARVLLRIRFLKVLCFSWSMFAKQAYHQKAVVLLLLLLPKMHFIGRRSRVVLFPIWLKKQRRWAIRTFLCFFRGWGCQSAKAFLLLSSVYFPLSAKTSESVKDSVFQWFSAPRDFSSLLSKQTKWNPRLLNLLH